MLFLSAIPLFLVVAGSSIVQHSEDASKSDKVLTKPIYDVENRTSGLTDERRLYLEDVFYSIKSMDWTEEEQLCLNQTLDMLNSLQNFTLWAVALWDATASDARGVLYGSKYQLGNYDECLKPVWSTADHPRLATQYCLADVELLMQPRNLPKYKIEFSPYQSALDKIYYTGDPSRRPLNHLTWGSCVPSACPPRSVARLLTTLLQRSNLAAGGLSFNVTVDSQCQHNSQHPYPSDTIAFFCFVGLAVAVVTVCSFLHWNYRRLDEEGPPFICAFSVLKNFTSLSKRSKGGLDVLYGIRYLSICFVVISHRYAVSSGGPITNGLESDQLYQMPLHSMFLVHDDLLVDTFFFMSGLLVTKILMELDRFPNVFFLLLKRYVRLAPALAMALWYMSSVFAYTGSGPLWKRTVDYEVPSCRRNWWVNLLMISNYYRADDMCIVTSWYIPCDMQFYVVAIWLCYLGRKSLSRLLCVTVPLAALALAVPAIITAFYQLPPVLLFVNSFVVDPRGNETFQRMYIPSHARAAPYIIGIATGYFITKLYPIDDTPKMSKKKSSFLAAIGLLVMFSMMVSGVVFYEADRQYYPVAEAIYASVNRPIWTLGLATVVLACVYGTVPLVTSMLSWSPWVSLNKLAYGLYLVHMFIIIKDVQTARDPIYYDPVVLIHRAAGDIIWGTAFSLILWLLVEAPCTNLLNMCLARGLAKPSTAANSLGNSSNNSQNARQFNIPESSSVPQLSDILRSKC